MDGVPWYLVDGAKNAQLGIALDTLDPAALAKLGRSDPGPCSDEYVVLLVRYATLNKTLRRKRLSINKLYGQKVSLDLNAEGGFEIKTGRQEKESVGEDGHLLRAATGRMDK